MVPFDIRISINDRLLIQCFTVFSYLMRCTCLGHLPKKDSLYLFFHKFIAKLIHTLLWSIFHFIFFLLIKFC